jgi:hypothetical protein
VARGALAQAVLRGRTRGYTRHPQLERFRAHPSPRLAINAYLAAIHDEATARGQFRARQGRANQPGKTSRRHAGQLRYEWKHLLGKLATRSPTLFKQLKRHKSPAPHPLFDPAPARWRMGAQQGCEVRPRRIDRSGGARSLPAHVNTARTTS